MNAIKAMERFNLLNNAINALSYSIEEASRRQDIYGRHALNKIREELTEERDELEKKLTEVQI